MLVSSSDGFCLEGLLSVSLLRAAAILDGFVDVPVDKEFSSAGRIDIYPSGIWI